jgi:integrase
MLTNLTAHLAKTLTCEPDKERSIYWDATTPGFGLCVTRNNARSYVVQYRANGVSRRLTLDANVLSLDAARKQARKHLHSVACGGDPVSERRREAARAEAAKSDTLEAVALNFFKIEGKNIRTINDRIAAFERLIFPVLGSRQISDISRSDITRLLDKIQHERGPVMADKALVFLSRLFNWHEARTDEFRSPIRRNMARTKPHERARDRVLSDDEIRAIWKATEQPGPFSSLVRFLLLTGTRRNEAARMTRAELTGSEWIIPARRHKSKKEFLLPLSQAAMDVLAAIPVIKQTGPVFTTDGERPFCNFDRAKKRLDRVSGTTGWRLHDLRRTARSLMSRAGVAPDHAERAIGHVINGVRGIYDRHSFYNEKKQAFEALARLVAEITQG